MLITWYGSLDVGGPVLILEEEDDTPFRPLEDEDSGGHRGICAYRHDPIPDLAS